ncbi:MAG: DUF2470 domain-containing protein [Myxococcota bacterium]
MKENADKRLPVDDKARRRAGNLLRCARHGALATNADGAVGGPAEGYPAVSRVSVATTMEGHPVFLISELSAHFGALERDPRASLLLGSPGRGDPLAHGRITVYGRAVRLADDDRTTARRRFLARHPKAALYADFADFAFWRLDVEGASFNGGFGQAYEMTPEDLLVAPLPELADMEEGAVEHMNDDHLDSIADYAHRLLEKKGDGWRLATLDPAGMDLVRADEVARLWFEPPLKRAAELRARLVKLARQARPSAS